MGRARDPRPKRPARRFAAWAGRVFGTTIGTTICTALLVALTVATGGALAQEAPDAAMPKAIKRYTDTRADCFLPDERQDYDEWIDQFRETIPGCETGVIPAQRTIQSYRVYKRGSNRVIDCSTLRKNEFGTRFLDTYLKEVVSRSEAAADSPKAAACAANMLHAWAGADAMTRLGDDGNTNQSQHKISWTLGGLSAAYFAHPEVREAAREIATENGTADDEIIAWFRELTGPVSAMIDREREAKNEDNLQYWRGYAILPTAFMAEDAELMAQSRRVFDAALDQVTMGSTDPRNDGFLPLEMERGDRSLHYQTYASMPVLAMAMMSKARGCGFLESDAQRERLTLMLSRALEGRAQPRIVARQVARYSKNGKAVEQKKTSTVRDAAQLIYLAYQIDPALYEAVDANLAAFTGEPAPVYKPSVGQKASYDRLGGDYRALAKAAKRDGPPPAPLAAVCEAGG